jgi:hypothetical protein
VVFGNGDVEQPQARQARVFDGLVDRRLDACKWSPDVFAGWVRQQAGEKQVGNLMSKWDMGAQLKGDRVVTLILRAMSRLVNG